MATTIIEVTDKAGKVRHRATVRLFRGGRYVYNKSQTFDTRKLAEAWARRVEVTLADEEKLAELTGNMPTLAELIGSHIEAIEKTRDLGGTKRMLLDVLKSSDMAIKPADKVSSQDIIEFCRNRSVEYGTGPEPLSQYITYLRQVYALADPMLGINVSPQAIDASKPTLKQLGLSGKSRARDRRLHGDEYQRLLDHFIANPLYDKKTGARFPMPEIFRFAIASAMRRAEITRIMWADVDTAKRTVIIRDRKDPHQKTGNDQIVPLLGEAWEIVQAMPRTDERIFPVDEIKVSQLFKAAVEKLGINDLHLHDLRHEATSRLFEQGYQIQEVAIVTGHRSWDMLKRYTQLRPESLHRD